jgi:hypothetical protein
MEAGGKLLPEDSFEVLGDGSSGSSSSGGCGSNGSKALAGPAKGRQHRAEARPALLSGWQVFVLGSGALKDSCTSLVKAAGGAVVARLPPASFASQQQQAQEEGGKRSDVAGQSGGERKLLVLMPEGAAAGSGGGSKGQLAHAEALGVPVLGQKWLMDSVSHMQLLPMEGFRA